MIVECKAMGADLRQLHASQLFRYFTVTSARIAILTNGVDFWFYSDLEEPNKMDERPFLVLDLRQLREDRAAQLKKLTKDDFDLPSILEVASDLKYMGEIRQVLERQFSTPDDEFVKFFFSAAAPGRKFMGSAREQFAPLVVRVMEQVSSTESAIVSARRWNGRSPRPKLHHLPHCRPRRLLRSWQPRRACKKWTVLRPLRRN